MKRQITIVMLIGLVASLLLACPADPTNNGNNGKTNGNEEEGKTEATDLKPHIDYPDWNGDEVDDRDQTFTPKNRNELFVILDYQKEHEDKGWMVKSIDVSHVKLAADRVTVNEDDEIDENGTETGYINQLFYEGAVYQKGDRSESFNQDISNWDVSNVTDMIGLFWGVEDFNQDISSWDISKVTDMDCLFIYAGSFDQDLSSWDVTGKITSYMFWQTPMEFKPNQHPQGCRCGASSSDENNMHGTWGYGDKYGTWSHAE